MARARVTCRDWELSGFKPENNWVSFNFIQAFDTEQAAMNHFRSFHLTFNSPSDIAFMNFHDSTHSSNLSNLSHVVLHAIGNYDSASTCGSHSKFSPYQQYSWTSKPPDVPPTI